RAKDSTGATSVMAARGAVENPSIFRAEGPVPAAEAVIEYLRTATRLGNAFGNTKYTLLQMHPDTKGAEYMAARAAKSIEAMCAALGVAASGPAAPAKRPASSPPPQSRPATPEPAAEPQKRAKVVDPAAT
ncbi:hypothetical protein H4R21_000489, partial [Coemansia helicoidea]